MATPRRTALNAFCSKVAQAEGGKSEARYGDVQQLTKLMNETLGNDKLYQMIEDWHASQPADTAASPAGDAPTGEA